jgi:hypothetical protein
MPPDEGVEPNIFEAGAGDDDNEIEPPPIEPNADGCDGAAWPNVPGCGADCPNVIVGADVCPNAYKKKATSTQQSA